MFCACMIGGTLYGTGYKFEHLKPWDRVTAMKVGTLAGKSFSALPFSDSMN